MTAAVRIIFFIVLDIVLKFKIAQRYAIFSSTNYQTRTECTKDTTSTPPKKSRIACCLCLVPQRQQIPQFSAVAERPFPPHPCYRPSGQHCLCYPFPQRHHFPRFAAVAECPFPPHSFGRSSLSLHQPYSFQRSNGNENHPEHLNAQYPVLPLPKESHFFEFLLLLRKE